MSAFATQTTACRSSHTPLRCVTTADQRAGSAFGLYASAQSAIGMPTSSTASASSLLVTDATHAQQVFQQLAASKSIAQYQKTVSASNLQQVLTSFSRLTRRWRQRWHAASGHKRLFEAGRDRVSGRSPGVIA